MNSKIFLIPNLISENSAYLSKEYYLESIHQVQIFFAENLKPARRFLKTLQKEIEIDHFEWEEMNDNKNLMPAFEQALVLKKNIGIISDAGCPCIADPGHHLVALAHKKNATLVPLIGPNSLILALMASGLNGQQFVFHGYLPIEEERCKNKIKELEKHAQQFYYTQIFIETPFRNQSLFQRLLTYSKPNTQICIAINLNTPQQIIQTKSVDDWKKSNSLNLHKQPAIFLLAAS